MSNPTPIRYGDYRMVDGQIVDESASGDASEFLEASDSEEDVNPEPVNDINVEDVTETDIVLED